MTGLVLAGCGASSAFGPSVAASRERLDADASALFRNAAFVNAAFRPQVCAFRERTGLATFEERTGTLASEAVDDLLRDDAVRALLERPLRVAVLLPEPGPGLAADRIEGAAATIAAAVGERVGACGGTAPDLATLAHGHATAGWALAHRLYRQARHDALLLVAADSYNDRKRLNALNDDGALYGDRNPYGLVPGEGAAAVLFAPEPSAEAGTAIVASAAATREAVTDAMEAETAFEAMSECIADACAAARSLAPPGDGNTRAIDAWVTDWNNGRYRATELAFARMRAAPFLVPDLEPVHLALLLGETGAAGTLLALALRESLMPDARTLLVTAGSAAGLRSAFVLHDRRPAGSEVGG